MTHFQTTELGGGGNRYSQAERDFLLKLAREAICDAVAGRPLPAPKEVPDDLKQERACFVTLREEGALRGCIGCIFPEGPLYQTVIDMARSAALRDARFPPVAVEEVARLHIEISVLSLPEPLAFRSAEKLLAQLRPGVDGVVLKLGSRRSTFLPQVWEQLPERREFLGRLCVKAGLRPTDWQDPDVKIETYRVEAFEEKE